MTTADKGARIGTLIIDYLIFLFVIGCLYTVLFAIFNLDSNWILAFIEDYFVIFYCCYYFSFEYFFGRTPGKYATGTVVVNRFGEKPSVKSIIIRTAARLVPYNGFSYLFGQGLHDYISNTVVVNNSKKMDTAR